MLTAEVAVQRATKLSRFQGRDAWFCCLFRYLVCNHLKSDMVVDYSEVAQVLLHDGSRK